MWPPSLGLDCVACAEFENVAVPCPRCGREYDVALFGFGRTIWCTCGGRVGLGPRRRSLQVPTEGRFIADAMLGKLARWLRLLGFDCAMLRPC